MSILNAGEDIVPTPVGVNREALAKVLTARDCPHARGGEPRIARMHAVERVLSPRPWG